MSRQKYEVNGATWKLSWRKFNKADAIAALAKVQDGRDRATDEAWVNALTRTMDLGLWEPHRPGQKPLAFDVNGNRINGKHRLQAFIRSKLPEIIFPVISGCKPQDFETFDQDEKARTKRAAHPDIAFVTRDQARISWVDKLVNADIRGKMTQPVFRRLWGKTWHKQIEWAIEVMPGASSHQRAPYAAAFMYVHAADPDFADKMGRAWVSGSGDLPASLRRIRDTALRTGAHRGGTGAAAMIRTTLKILTALASVHKGAEVKEARDSLAGLRYFSEKLRDGAISRWSKASPLNEAEA